MVRDFVDFCFHSYFSYMDELSEKVPEDENPMDVKYDIFPTSVIHSPRKKKSTKSMNSRENLILLF